MVNSEQASKELGLSFMFSGIVEQSTQYIRRAVDELCSHQVCGILIHLPWEMDLRDLQVVCRNVPFGPVVDGDWTAQSGFEATQKLITNHRGKFTAVVVANDQMALGAIRAFEENSIPIPQEISLVGFDDIPEAGFFRPPLSTIKQDFATLGRLSIQCLTAQVDQSRASTSSTHTIQPFLIERESTARLAGILTSPKERRTHLGSPPD